MSDEKSKIWPWILPLPMKDEHYNILLSIFKSKITLDIIRNINISGKTYQSDLIRKLPYSNKTIIIKLKELVKSKLLEQGVEKVTVNGRAVWVKWYKPTTWGRWVITFLTPPSRMKREKLKETFQKLLRLYIQSIAEFCLSYDIDLSEYHSILDEEYIFKFIEKARSVDRRVDVAVFGSTAMDIIVTLDQPPSIDETVLAKKLTISVGGSAANVAVGLARLGVKASFIGKIGTDGKSRLALIELAREGVDISSIKVAKGASIPEAIIFIEKGNKKILTIADEETLSLSSPSEVNWKVIDSSKAIYVGEVYVEVASAITSYAKSRGKQVIYRLLTPYARMGLGKLKSIITNSDYILMNEVGWKLLLKSSSTCKLNSPTDLLKLGARAVIITRSSKGVEVWTEGEKISIPPIKVNAIDTTGAGDSFSAGFIWSILSGQNIKRAVEIANAIAAISTTKVGAKNSLPKLSEVREVLAKLNLI